MSTIYLTLALPELQIGVPLEISRSELDFMLEQNLSQSHKKAIDDLRRLVDITNAVKWLQKRPMMQQGTIVPVENYEIALLQKDEKVVPLLILQFMEKYPEARDRKEKSETLLLTYLEQFFSPKDIDMSSNNTKKVHPTVLKIYEIEHVSRCLFAYLRAVDNENEDEVEKYETLIRATFDYSFKTQENIPDIYKPLYHIWHEFKSEPYRLHQELVQWKFDAFDSLLSKESFSSRCESFGIDQIIVYCAQYDLLESEERKKTTSYMSFINRIYKVEEK